MSENVLSTVGLPVQAKSPAVRSPEGSDSTDSNGGKKAEKHRKKRWAAKVSTGCLTCRSRRIKCDEGKPSCLRCIASKRSCGGYGEQPASVPLGEHQFHGLTPVYAQSTWREKQMFSVFSTQTVREVCGLFDHEFWHTDVLRATQTHSALWHASLAMAAMHRWSQEDVDSDHGQRFRHYYYNFALKQYNAAIEQLVRLPTAATEPSSVIVSLMASILFTGLCSIRGDPREAMVHANHGIQLADQCKLLEQRELAASKSVLPTASLAALIDRFEVQYIWTGVREPIRKSFKRPITSSSQSFVSVSEASSQLQPMIGDMQLVIRSEKYRRSGGNDMPLPRADPRLACRASFMDWSKRFSKLVQSGTLSKVECDSAKVLDMWATGLEAGLYLDFSKYGLAWDEFVPSFRRIVILASEVLTKYEANPRGPAFLFAPSVCEPLYMAASHCRDPTVRREAISLLRKWPRREGIWDTTLMAALAEARMVLEEKGAVRGEPCDCVGGFICVLHRIQTGQVEFLDDGGVSFNQKTLGDVLSGRAGEVLFLSWKDGSWQRMLVDEKEAD